MKNKKIIASCMLALSLIGCTGLEAGNGGYTAGGAAGGAAVGALAGQIIGKDTKGTLIGAAVGSLLGMGWGAYRDNQERELKNRLEGTQAEVRRDGNALVINLPGGVTFASDSANISSDFYSALNGIAQTLNNYPETRIQVNGYTDSTGGSAHNQDLSQRRANSVAQYFIAQGVSANRISANGFGSSNPIASNSTSEGRQANRRVEVKILPAQ
ncbi:OmpA family protein [Fusobacterium nucleatum]|uniref:OmpA family protein n=1 Tax=Fusobacterium nucleatum TaxID=851 RepID=UPI003CFD83D7